MNQNCCSNLVDLLSPRMFKALGEPNRISILSRLAACRRPCTVSELAECCPVNISVVSRHLAILREAGIVEAEKRGKEVYYSVCVNFLAATLRKIADAIESCCATNPAKSENASPPRKHQGDPAA